MTVKEGGKWKRKKEEGVGGRGVFVSHEEDGEAEGKHLWRE